MKRSIFSFSSMGLLVVGLFLAVPPAMLAQQPILSRISRNMQVETKMSKMALKNSGNADVQKFAKQVIKDNGPITGEVFSASIAHSITLQIDIPDATSAAMKNMKQLKGTDFDKVYLVQMDAFVKDDKDAATQASAERAMIDVSTVGDQLQELVNRRTKQIPQLTMEEGYKIQ